MWYRVFAGNDREPSPGAILECVAGTGTFGGDDAGWFRADLLCGETALHLERYLSHEEGVRAELNGWAAFVESCGAGAAHAALMERLVQSKQVFTLQRPDEAGPLDAACVALCALLARATAGVYQVDERGFFAADGTRLIAES